MNKEITMKTGYRRVFLMGVVALLFIGLGAFGSKAQAYEGITELTAGPSTTQAGGHPDIEIHSAFDNRYVNDGEFEFPEAGSCECEDAAVIVNHLPTGFIGNPHAVPKCSLADFSIGQCPVESQVGIYDFVPHLLSLSGYVPIFNMEPHPNEAGLIAFQEPISGAVVFVSMSARTGSDYGLDATTTAIFHFLALYGTDIYLWGVPADPIHDMFRFPRGTPRCTVHSYPDEPCYPPQAIDIPPIPFISNPTTCGVPLEMGMTVQYYTGRSYFESSPWPATTGCDQLSFNPSLTATTTTKQADTPSGLDVELKVPQPVSPDVPSSSELRATTVTLPEEISINPNAADGKTVCTETEGSFGTQKEAHCPETAKIGTLQIDSSALPGVIDGAIFLGESLPGDKYRIFLTADGFATHVKLAGSVRPNPETGQLVVSFLDLPQAPFQDFDMHFFGSERGILATPTQCGAYAVNARFVPWDSALPDQTSRSQFTIDTGPNGEPCPGRARPFDPEFRAGTADNTAGVYSSLHLELRRNDGDQNVTGLDIGLPPGLTGKLANLPYCPETALAELAGGARAGMSELMSPACPATSQVGIAIVGTGAGSHPLFTAGKAYLAGPYKGAPLSIEVVVPAVSGPYDLGVVAVRSAVYVDPITAQVSAISDRLPQILDGIPLRLRSIRVDLDHPDFMLNPTSCDPFAITTKVTGNQGAVADPESRFQVANCASMNFAPRVRLDMSGGLNRRGHPALKASVVSGPGQANLGRAVVTLPPNELLDNAHIKTVCTRVQFAADTCPPDSIYGQAEAITPLLDKPLVGPVYLRSSDNPLPDLVVGLDGQIEIDLIGKIDTAKGGLRATFAYLPDAPISRFTLQMQGGKKGLLVNRGSLCKKGIHATATFTGQNGILSKQAPRLNAACGARVKKQKRGHRRARRGGESGRGR